MRNVAIITAKGGNESVQNKNIIPILGVPIVLYPLRAALQARFIDEVYVSTEDPAIRYISEREGAKTIDRPKGLSTPESQHKEVIRHAVRFVESNNPDLQNIVVLLGNTVMVTSGLINKAV